MAKKKAAKPRAKKYEPKLKIDTSFENAIQILVTPKPKDKEQD